MSDQSTDSGKVIERMKTEAGQNAQATRHRRPLLGILLLAIISAVALPLTNILFVGPAYEQIIISTMEGNAGQLARQLIPSSFRNSKITNSLLDSPRFYGNIYRLETDIGVHRVRVFSSYGVILYSTDPKEIGTMSRHEHMATQEGRRQVYSKMDRGERALIDTYLPLLYQGRYLGAFEIAFDATEAISDLERFNAYVTHATIFLCSILLVAVILLLRMESSRYDAHQLSERLKADVDRITRHDIKTPLASALAGINYLERYTAVDNDQKEVLGDMRIAVNTGLELINRSMDIYMMETGQYQYAPEEFDLIRVCRRVVADLSRQAADRGTAIQVELSGKPVSKTDSLMISAEKTLCYSLVANLARNSVEATPKGEAVRISITANTHLAIAVHNMGMVPEEVRDNFFDKYVTAGKTQGTGLGTYSARLMTRTMGGDIAMVTSGEGGTTVTVTLPITA